MAKKPKSISIGGEKMKKLTAVLALLIIASLAFTACAPAAEPVEKPVVVEEAPAVEEEAPAEEVMEKEPQMGLITSFLTRK